MTERNSLFAPTSGAGAATAGTGLGFLGAGLFSTSQRRSRNAVPPVVVSGVNNAYFTGLDTSSHTSRGSGGGAEYYAPVASEARRSEGGTTFVDAPPVYWDGKEAKRSGEDDVFADNPTARDREEAETGLFAPPPVHRTTATQHDVAREEADTGLFPMPPTLRVPPTLTLMTGAGGLLRPPTSRSQRSERSFTSTLYSDTASVHSAKAARVSRIEEVASNRGSATSAVAGGGRFGSQEDRDPFEDPVSAVSAEEGEEGEGWLGPWGTKGVERSGSGRSGISAQSVVR